MDDNQLKPLEVAINDSTSILVKPVSAKIDINQNIWAINWFNFKYRKLYSLYLMLAKPLVERIGGRMIFKGQINRMLTGAVEDSREMLVIVRYPGINSFIDILKKKYFQLLSVIRNKSLVDFTFGFTKNLTADQIDTQQSLWDEYDSIGYLVHHFKADDDPTNRMMGLMHEIKSEGIRGFFCGITAAEVGRKIRSTDTRYIPMFDGIILFEANGPDAMQKIMDHPDYKSFKKANTSNCAAIFTRLE